MVEAMAIFGSPLPTEFKYWRIDTVMRSITVPLAMKLWYCIIVLVVTIGDASIPPISGLAIILTICKTPQPREQQTRENVHLRPS